MSDQFKLLFSPIKIGSMVAPNHIVGYFIQCMQVLPFFSRRSTDVLAIAEDYFVCKCNSGTYAPCAQYPLIIECAV